MLKILTLILLPGIFVTLANAPFYHGYLGLAVFVPLIYFWDHSAKHRFWIGWLAGFFTQLLAYYWIFLTIRDFGGQSVLISLTGAFLFWLYQGLDMAFWLWLSPWLAARLPGWCRPFSAAGGWYLLQAGLFPYVFPWHHGATFISQPGLDRAAAFWSANGMGYLAVLVSAVILLGFYRGQPLRARWLLAGSVLGLMVMGRLFHVAKTGETWRIAVIQPNLIPWAKQDLFSAERLFNAHYEPSLALLEEAPDLVLWPETAISFNLRAYPRKKAKIQALADRLDAGIITGVIGMAPKGGYHNEIWLFSPGEHSPQVYQKEKLVWFSESLPGVFAWAKYFDSGIGNFLPGENNRVFRFRDRELVPLVCFEALFPRYVQARSGHLMINLTNDAWFGLTKASSQHLQQIRPRTVEQGVPLVRATNSGISCWVDTEGQIRDAGPLYEKRSFVFEVPVPREKPKTFSFWGDALCGAFSYALVLWGLGAHVFKWRRQPAPSVKTESG